MKRVLTHPEDFCSFLDQDTSDPAYEQIRAHLSGCPQCREDVKGWESIDAWFRSGESTIEVPPFQWRRIAARLQEPQPVGWLVRLRTMLRPWRPAWNVTVGSLVLAGMILGGLEYRRINEEKQLLLAVTRYVAEEGARIGTDGNPFRVAATSDNPFSKSKFPIEGKH
jgi:anti-sigma factor RsiW